MVTDSLPASMLVVSFMACSLSVTVMVMFIMTGFYCYCGGCMVVFMVTDSLPASMLVVFHGLFSICYCGGYAYNDRFFSATLVVVCL
jgi:hypothetical protein